MVKYVVFFVVAVCLAAIIGWLPTTWLQPVRSAELRLLYRASTEGPGGLDDAVQMLIINHPGRYTTPLLRMLQDAKPGSSDEEVALYFIELVRGPAEIDAFLTDFAEHHPDPKVRQFLRDLVGSPTPQEIIAQRKR